MIRVGKPWSVQPQPQAILSGVDGFYYASVACDKYNAPGRLPGISSGKLVNSHGLAGELILTNAMTTAAITPVASSWTILMDFKLVSAASVYPYMMGISGAPNTIALGVRHASYTNNVVWYDGTTIHNSGLLIPIGDMAVLGITYNRTTNVYSFFKDGISGNSPTGVFTGSGDWRFAGIVNQSNTTNINLLAYSDKCVAPARMRELTANPWKIFSPIVRRIPVVSVGDTTLAASSAALASTTGAITTGIPLAASSAGVATASAALTAGSTGLAANAAAAAAATAALNTGIPIVSAPSAVASTTGAITTGISIVASATAIASTTGAITTGISLAAGSTAVATVSASLTADGTGMAASSVATAAATGALTTGIPVAASTSVNAAAGAALITGIRLVTNAQSAAVTTATLSGSAAQLAAVAIAQASASAALTVQIRLDATASAQAAASATMAGNQAQLAGVSAVVSTASAALTAQPLGLAGAIMANPAAYAALLTSIRLAGAAVGTATATAALPESVEWLYLQRAAFVAPVVSTLVFSDA